MQGQVCSTPLSLSEVNGGVFGVAQAQEQFKNPVSIADIGSIDDFVAIYVPGGHGVVEDGPASKKLADLLQQFYEAGKVVSSVCHGPSSFTGAVKANGEALVKGKKVGLLLLVVEPEPYTVSADPVTLSANHAMPFLLNHSKAAKYNGVR